MSRLLLLLSLFFTQAFSWGRDGHEIVADLAWRLLSNHSRDMVVEILNLTDALAVDVKSTRGHHASNHSNHSDECDDCSPLAKVADWADAVRHYWPWSSVLHYIDIPDDNVTGGCPVQPSLEPSLTCYFDYERDCVDDRCVAGSIVNYTAQLSDPVLRRQALMFVGTCQGGRVTKSLLANCLSLAVHFVGDIHQPLHASRASDEGGNLISVYWLTQERLRGAVSRSHGSNLHSLWDTGIIDKCIDEDFGGSRAAMTDALFAELRPNLPAACAGDLHKCTVNWGQESLEYALAYAYRSVDGKEILDGAHLHIDYYAARLPIVKERLIVAGVRLAAVLEEAMGEQRVAVAL